MFLWIESFLSHIYNPNLIELKIDKAEMYDFWPRLWLFYSPLLFSPKKRGKKKRRMNRKNGDQKSCLSARSKKSTSVIKESPLKWNKQNISFIRLFDIFVKLKGKIMNKKLQYDFSSFDGNMFNPFCELHHLHFRIRTSMEHFQFKIQKAYLNWVDTYSFNV